MAAVLLMLVVMANSANTNVIVPNHDRAAPPNNSSAERIARAQSTHNKIFVAYVVVLALTVIGTYFVWSSGNAAQGAIQDASNAETELAKQKASEADARAKVAEDSAGRANVRASEIEESNLKLRSQIGNLEIQAADAQKDVARLEKDAADARAAQQKVEAQLAVQQEKAAVAERSLLELQERIKPRRLTDKQALDFVEALKAISPGTIDFGYTSGAGDEGFNFAKQMLPLFKEAGWTVRNENSITDHLEIQVIGVGILTRGPASLDPSKPPPPSVLELTPTLATLQSALKAVGLEPQFINWHPGEGDIPEVVVGSKPEPKP